MMTFGDLNLARKNVTDNIVEILKVNYCIWPLVNYLNFRIIPIKFRILVVNICGLMWNAYMAHVNQKSADKNSEI
jgi:protein Mpv17